MQTMNNYVYLQNQIKNLNEIELIEVIGFIISLERMKK
jgi:hypothetical protein